MFPNIVSQHCFPTPWRSRPGPRMGSPEEPPRSFYILLAGTVGITRPGKGVVQWHVKPLRWEGPLPPPCNLESHSPQAPPRLLHLPPVHPLRVHSPVRVGPLVL